MYRWYKNSAMCYAYLHNLASSSFPIVGDDERYPDSRGWLEWFSCGWMLQEMIAPQNVQFFNKDWHPIGDKRTLSLILENITHIPQHILNEGLSSNRPCVAQIMSWAADRMTTRVEDRAYSLMGLLDVNMPMLYGEGKKAFHRLQLEIIRMSNDHSIFAWGCNKIKVQNGSILADDLSFFQDCDKMELMDQDKFIESVRGGVPEEELPSIEDDQLGTFLVTNHGIQIWLFLCSAGSDSVFEAQLLVHWVHMWPSIWLCGNPITIDIRLQTMKSGVCNYVTSISDIKTCHNFATPHLNLMTLQSSRRVSPPQICGQRD